MAKPDQQPASSVDHVDRVIEQWGIERPDLDLRPTAIVARLGRAVSFTDQRLESFFAQHGLTRGLWDVLASLRRTGAPFRLSPTELAKELMRTTGTMTGRLAQLQDEGLIRRVPDPADGRGMLVELTAKGRRLVDRLAAEHLANERQILAGISASDQKALAALLADLLKHLELPSS